ncbi:MAG: hypothetical protein RL477_2121 [Pseudomonadota bacterium]|jgi:hypothetical protein
MANNNQADKQNEDQEHEASRPGIKTLIIVLAVVAGIVGIRMFH